MIDKRRNRAKQEHLWLVVTAAFILGLFGTFIFAMTRSSTRGPGSGTVPAWLLDRAWHQKRHQDCLADPLRASPQRIQLPQLCEEDGRKWCDAAGLEPACYTNVRDSG